MGYAMNYRELAAMARRADDKVQEAIQRALASGATVADIESETALQLRQVGTVPFNHMIRALNLHSWHNTRQDWTRLAGALSARAAAKR